MTKNNKILISNYNDLSKLYNIKDNKLYKVIPSPNHFYSTKRNRLYKVLNNKNKQKILIDNYSILGFNNSSSDDNVARLIKFKSGRIVLKIPYLKLIKLYME